MAAAAAAAEVAEVAEVEERVVVPGQVPAAGTSIHPTDGTKPRAASISHLSPQSIGTTRACTPRSEPRGSSL